MIYTPAGIVTLSGWGPWSEAFAVEVVKSTRKADNKNHTESGYDPQSICDAYNNGDRFGKAEQYQPGDWGQPFPADTGLPKLEVSPVFVRSLHDLVDWLSGECSYLASRFGPHGNEDELGEFRTFLLYGIVSPDWGIPTNCSPAGHAKIADLQALYRERLEALRALTTA